MSVLDPRTRLITFRLSDREYRRLRAVCNALHARSLSDFVRSGVCWILRESNQGLAEMIADSPYPAPAKTAAPRSLLEARPDDSGAVQKLERRMNSLAREVKRLSKLVPDGSRAQQDAPKAVRFPPRADASPDRKSVV